MVRSVEQRLRDDLLRLSVRGRPVADFFEESGRMLRTAIPFDGFCSMTVDPATGLLSWSPSASNAGTHTVILRVQDGRGGSDAGSVSKSCHPRLVLVATPRLTLERRHERHEGDGGRRRRGRAAAVPVGASAVAERSESGE